MFSLKAESLSQEISQLADSPVQLDLKPFENLLVEFRISNYSPSVQSVINVDNQLLFLNVLNNLILVDFIRTPDCYKH